jgi:hypothetical protein
LGISPGCFGCHPSSSRVRRLEARQSIAGGLADDGHVQAAADHAGDVAERHALVGDPVIPGSCGTLLKHEPVEMSSIEPVHRGPAVKPVAMDRWRKPYHRRGYAL